MICARAYKAAADLHRQHPRGGGFGPALAPGRAQGQSPQRGLRRLRRRRRRPCRAQDHIREHRHLPGRSNGGGVLIVRNASRRRPDDSAATEFIESPLVDMLRYHRSCRRALHGWANTAIRASPKKPDGSRPVPATRTSSQTRTIPRSRCHHQHARRSRPPRSRPQRSRRVCRRQVIRSSVTRANGGHSQR